MIKIENLDNVTSSGITYGGHGGSKKGIILNNERWFLKYPKSTKSLSGVLLSYSTTPLSEYLGSHIYSSLGIDTHETILVINDGKVVVACKDFLKSSEIILDYNSLKNDYDKNLEKELESLSSSSDISDNDLDEIKLVMEKNKYFDKAKELKTRFWDMFIVDALISNNDRNEGNWGLILNKENGNLRLAPVYDNGASFYNKSDDIHIKNILDNEASFKQVAYESSVSIFSKNGKKINPLKYIESKLDKDCNDALIRIYPKIDLDKIKNIIDSIPEKYNDLHVMSKYQKELYYKVLEYRYNYVFKPTYEKLLKESI